MVSVIDSPEIVRRAGRSDFNANTSNRNGLHATNRVGSKLGMNAFQPPELWFQLRAAVPRHRRGRCATRAAAPRSGPPDFERRAATTAKDGTTIVGPPPYSPTREDARCL